MYKWKYSLFQMVKLDLREIKYKLKKNVKISVICFILIKILKQ